jgi:hypothetical protein
LGARFDGPNRCRPHRDRLRRWRTIQSQSSGTTWWSACATSIRHIALRADEPKGTEAAAVGLAYGMGGGLLTRTRFGPVFFKEGHGDASQNYMICFERRQPCMILLINSDNGELAFRPLLETVDDQHRTASIVVVTNWPAAVNAKRQRQTVE